MSTDHESDIESLADALNGGASGGAASGGDDATASVATSAPASGTTSTTGTTSAAVAGTTSNDATAATPAHSQPDDGKRGLNKAVKTILAIILVLLLVIGGVVVGANWNRWFGADEPQSSSAELDPNAEDYTGAKGTYEGKKNTDSIAIPGFGSLNFQSGTTTQQVNFYNPEENTCYFKMSLYLPDGTKLWESQMVEPGKAVYTITLNQVVPKGTYKDAVLKYECFSLTDQSQLNGSEVKFTLNVID